MASTIRFTSPRLQYGWLSNMAMFPINDNGKIYPSSEHYFICNRIKNSSVAERIRLIKSPMYAKRESSKQLKKYDSILVHPRQSRLDVKLMFKTLLLKLYFNQELIDALLNTNDYPIIEDCTNRAKISDSSFFWGKSKLWDNDDTKCSYWVGMNILGRLWMFLRDQLRMNKSDLLNKSFDVYINNFDVNFVI